MKKNLILHIGQSKTGTSAIQDHLARNRSNLLKEGFLYPRVSRGGVALDIANHNGFADSLIWPTAFPKLTAEDYFSQFFKQISETSCHTVILSAEHFFGGIPRVWNISSPEEYKELYKKKLRTLAEFTSEFRVEAICYLRPQASWLSSGLNQSIKTARLINSSQNIYLGDRDFYEKRRETFRYSERLTMWADIIKPQSIIAVPYNRSNLIGRDSVLDFEGRTALAQLKLPIRAKLDINQSLSIEYLEVKKILNETKKSEPEERAAIKALLHLSAKSKLGKKYMVEPDVVMELAEYVHEDNLILSKKFMNDEHSLTALSGYTVAELRRPTAQEVSGAMEAYKRHRRSPSMVTYLGLTHAKKVIRKRAPTLHSALNVTKRILQAIRDKSRDGND